MKLLHLGFYHGTLRSFCFRTRHTKISPPFCSNHFSACYNVSQLNYSTTFQRCTLRFFSNTWDCFAIPRHIFTFPVHALPIRYITFCFNSIPIHFRTLPSLYSALLIYTALHLSLTTHYTALLLEAVRHTTIPLRNNTVLHYTLTTLNSARLYRSKSIPHLATLRFTYTRHFFFLPLRLF